MCVDSSDLNSPVAMETDVPLIEDVQMLKKTVEEGATQVTPDTLSHSTHSYMAVKINQDTGIKSFNFYFFLFPFHLFVA